MGSWAGCVKHSLEPYEPSRVGQGGFFANAGRKFAAGGMKRKLAFL